MMENVVTNGTGTSANFSGQDIAGKTGTTTSRKDLWFVGYTPYYTAAVWTGYDQQERLDSRLSNPSTGMWNKVMSRIHANLPYKEFPQPDEDSLKTISYCTSSGLLASSYCGSHIASMKIFSEDVPTSYCNVHRYTAPVTKPSASSSGQGSTSNSNSTTGNTNTSESTSPATDTSTAPAETAPAAESEPVSDPAASATE